MRRSEMTQQQLETRQIIIDTLGREWESMNNDELFDQDYWYEFEASLEYEGEDRRAEVSYSAGEGYLFIDMTVGDEGASLKVFFTGHDQLARVLDVMHAFPYAESDLEDMVWRVAITGVEVQVFSPEDDDWVPLDTDDDDDEDVINDLNIN